MVLEVQIGDIEVDRMGWNWGGGFDHEVLHRFGVGDPPGHKVMWTLDGEAGTGTNHGGKVVKLSPFMGVMGMPPDEAGNHDTGPPRKWGGNLDCKELVSGSSLYLPIPVDGALFSVGDGHARQGDGEISGTAIECPMRRVDLTFVLHDDMTLYTPIARVPGAWLTFGLHESLDEAKFDAINAMLDLIEQQYDVSRKDAFSLASVVVDLRVTQLPNGTQGIHAVLADGAIT